MLIERRSWAVLAMLLPVVSPLACTPAEDAGGALGANSGDGAVRQDAGQDSALRDGANDNAPRPDGDAAHVTADANDSAVVLPDSAVDAAGDADGGGTPRADAGSSRRSAGCGL